LRDGAVFLSGEWCGDSEMWLDSGNILGVMPTVFAGGLKVVSEQIFASRMTPRLLA
jgi:hypothetical protein